MNPPQVYMCSPSWTLLPPPSPFHPSGSSQCTSPKHPVSCIEPDRQLISYMIFYMFQCHSPKSSHPLPLPQSPSRFSSNSNPSMGLITDLSSILIFLLHNTMQFSTIMHVCCFSDGACEFIWSPPIDFQGYKSNVLVLYFAPHRGQYLVDT